MQLELFGAPSDENAAHKSFLGDFVRRSFTNKTPRCFANGAQKLRVMRFWLRPLIKQFSAGGCELKIGKSARDRDRFLAGDAAIAS